jgi:site-specific DNA-methyltransferase (adenine-specific)
MNKVHYSNKSNEWETPQYLFNILNDEFHFTLDPCATEQNAKCINYYTKVEDGLNKSWQDEVVFMNPPYGHNIRLWIEKVYTEIFAVIVCLIPSRTDTRYWHDYCMKADEIRFIRGRINFVGGETIAPFPSAIVIFRHNSIENIYAYPICKSVFYPCLAH